MTCDPYVQWRRGVCHGGSCGKTGRSRVSWASVHAAPWTFTVEHPDMAQLHLSWRRMYILSLACQCFSSCLAFNWNSILQNRKYSKFLLNYVHLKYLLAINGLKIQGSPSISQVSVTSCGYPRPLPTWRLSPEEAPQRQGRHTFHFTGLQYSWLNFMPWNKIKMPACIVFICELVWKLKNWSKKTDSINWKKRSSYSPKPSNYRVQLTMCFLSPNSENHWILDFTDQGTPLGLLLLFAV